MNFAAIRLLPVAFCTAFLLLLFGCSRASRTLDQILRSGHIRVLTINSETTFYEDRSGNSIGLEHDMVKDFARYLGVETKFIVYNTMEELFDALEMDKGDFIAAGVTANKKRKSQYAFGPSYQSTQQQVLCHLGVKTPLSLKSLEKLKLVVGAETSYQHRLEELQEDQPKLEWVTAESESTTELIHMVSEKRFDCTIADSHILSIYRRYYPQLKIGMELGDLDELAWVLKSEQEDLQNEMKRWFESLEKSKLKGWMDIYYSHVEDFDPFDLNKFNERIDTRLPEFRDLFKKAAKKYNWNWSFLAAVAYQESHWSPTAKSPTGVRGMMMLTENTALELGVKDRLDPEESVDAGARYLRLLEQRLPDYIKAPDRNWIALASYNVGYAHIRDARGLAAWQEENPNSWSGIRSVLPLLSVRKYYKMLPHGFARGREPVIYVGRIRNYQNLLLRKISNQ